MAISLRQVAASCLGLGGAFSVRRDVYGYIYGPAGRALRLTSHLRLIRGPSINLSLILVAHEDDFSGQFSLADVRRMQGAIQRTRELYEQAGLGVRRLYWQRIPVANAGGYSIVDSEEATELTEDWSGANDGIDVFWVSSVTDAAGWSDTDGPCDKDEDKEQTGVVLELVPGDVAGIVLAHEIGHYLRLGHAGDITNVMGTAGRVGTVDLTSVNLTAAQGGTMRSGCWVRGAC